MSSQPKINEDDAQDEIRKVHHLKTDPKCIIRLARALFAAPLADKTGGGE